MLGAYIFDFCCFASRVLIELDGSQHMLPEHVMKDSQKQQYAEALGYRVLRFYNTDVEENLEGVLLVIERAVLG